MTRPIKKEMTVYDIARELSTNSGLTVLQGRQMVFMLLRIIKQELLLGRPVKLWDFGRFGFRLWTGRKMRLAGKGEPKYYPNKLCLKFYVSSGMRKAVDRIPISAALFQKPAPRGMKRPVRKVSITL